VGRVVILVMDSVGIGSANDAEAYGDKGADTFGHVAEYCAVRRGEPLEIPHLLSLGLGEASRLATGRSPRGLDSTMPITGRYGYAVERSCGKDTPSGHWEIGGLPVLFEWGYFARTQPCFPEPLVQNLCRLAGLPGILGNCHASGTAIIAAHGVEHMRTDRPICYTSADSVFQIAAHEVSYGLGRLYRTCETAREICNDYKIGRVIARPFTGDDPDTFVRTERRRDFGVEPPGPTLLALATSAGREVVSVGKIADIFNHAGTGRVLKATCTAGLMEVTCRALETLAEGGLIFTNLVDFDTLFGHRRDPLGYGAELECFDHELGTLLEHLRPTDLVIVTADHGCDPTWPGTDHTREFVPILASGPVLPGSMGRRSTFADIAAACADYLNIPAPSAGTATGFLG
jgi:phosphopentomutase